jgi:hypothetical protein
MQLMRRRRPMTIAALFATAAVTATVVAVASAQSGRVVLQVRPTKLGPTQNALLVGAVSGGRGGEWVTLQAKDCGLSSFRNVFVITTGPGGRWQREYGPGVNTVLRARWKSAVSAPVAVAQSPIVHLDQLSIRRFEVGVGSQGRMWRKRVQIQRRSAGSWLTVRQVVLTETYSTPGQGSGTFTDAEFTATFPDGTALRAVLPLAQARPCYLRGVSNPIRTQG